MNFIFTFQCAIYYYPTVKVLDPILSDYIYDFSILGLPSNLTIKSNPSKEDYNILRRSHVTLNYELYKLYECGYFTNERSFIKYVIDALQE